MAKKVRTASPPRGRGKPQIRALGAAALALALACPATLQAEEAAEDRVFLEKRLSKILEFERTGAEIPWSNPKTGNSGKIQLMRTYFLDPKTPCRDYMRTIDAGAGEPTTVRGTGCREATGGWKLTEDSKPKRTVKRGGKEGKAAAATPGATGAAAKAPAAGAPASTKAKPAAAKKAPAAPAKKVAKAPPPPPKISARLPSQPPEWEAASDNAY